MPYVVVTAPPLADPAAEVAALAAVAAVVAAALELTPTDVQVALVHVATAVLGPDPVRAWPVVALHGRARPPELTAAAVDAAATAVRRHWAADDAYAHWAG